MWTSENEMVMECRDCGYRGNWREFDFHFGDACPECGSRAVGKSAEQSVHLTGGSRVVGEANSENYVRWQNGDLPEEPASR